MEYLLAVPVVFGVLFLSAVYFSFAYGYVTSCIWQWYLVPLGLPVVHWKVCAAVLMLVGMMRTQTATTPENKKSDDAIAKFLVLMISPWFVLALAWFIRN